MGRKWNGLICVWRFNRFRNFSSWAGGRGAGPKKTTRKVNSMTPTSVAELWEDLVPNVVWSGHRWVIFGCWRIPIKFLVNYPFILVACLVNVSCSQIFFVFVCFFLFRNEEYSCNLANMRSGSWQGSPNIDLHPTCVTLVKISFKTVQRFHGNVLFTRTS